MKTFIKCFLMWLQSASVVIRRKLYYDRMSMKKETL